MKKVLVLILTLGLIFTTGFNATAQDEAAGQTEAVNAADATEEMESEAADAVPADAVQSTIVTEDESAETEAPKDAEKLTGHKVILQKFLEGTASFMALPLICLILGLAIALERILSLSLASINNAKFIDRVEEALVRGGVEEAKDVCRDTRGPVASIFYQGLDRTDEGLEMVEKSVISYGSVQMGQLEKGLVWISLFIALAPMLGFLGTVIGMIMAFDKIQTVGDISPSIVAGGIKVALLTTVAGLIVAIILQLFYNYLVSRVDSITNKMEDASIRLIDMMIRHKVAKL